MSERSSSEVEHPGENASDEEWEEKYKEHVNRGSRYFDKASELNSTFAEDVVEFFGENEPLPETPEEKRDEEAIYELKKALDNLEEDGKFLDHPLVNASDEELERMYKDHREIEAGRPNEVYDLDLLRLDDNGGIKKEKISVEADDAYLAGDIGSPIHCLIMYRKGVENEVIDGVVDILNAEEYGIDVPKIHGLYKGREGFEDISSSAFSAYVSGEMSEDDLLEYMSRKGISQGTAEDVVSEFDENIEMSEY